MNKKTGSKGHGFEERLRTYFDQAGFFAVRGVSFRFEDEDVSDIDVWLYERPNAIARRRTIVDAKNRLRPKAVERILWLKGFQEGLRIESAVVATTDTRSSIKRFAESVGLSVLDGGAIERLDNTEKLDGYERLSSEEFIGQLSLIDKARGSKQWRAKFESCKTSLITNLGFLSTNENIDSAKFFLENAFILDDAAKEACLRAFLALLSYSAISLDYAIKDFSFRSLDERNEALRLGLRFGEGGGSSTLESVRIAIQLVRQYADNGNAVARQVQTKFSEAANHLPVEIIAEFVAKIAPSDNLFRVAKELDRAAYLREMTSFDSLSVDAKSFVGVFLDYVGIPRKKLASQLDGAPRKRKKQAGSIQSALPFSGDDKQQ